VMSAYLLRVQSYHDFVHMCAGQGEPWNTRETVESNIWPMVRRATYISGNIILLLTFVVFLLLFKVDNPFVVMTEYILLAIVVTVSVVNMGISHHISMVYSAC